jgi:hypothetical protein
MNRLELGKYWHEQLCSVIPNASIRLVTRMAWRLASLSVENDEDLIKLPDPVLARFRGGSERFLELRAQYVRCLSSSTRNVRGVVPLVRPVRFGASSSIGNQPGR